MAVNMPCSQNVAAVSWTDELYSFFKTLVNHEVTVELKNDISIRGTLKSVDQYLNIKLDNISVLDELSYPHLVSHIIRTPKELGNTRLHFEAACSTLCHLMRDGQKEAGP